MPLVIPEESAAPIGVLISLTPNQREALITSLRNATPSTSPAHFASSIPPIEGIDRRALTEMVLILTALYGLLEQHGHPAQVLAADLIDAAEERNLGASPHTAEQRADLEAFLVTVLSLDETLGLTSKAGEILIENETNYGSARIVTDLRPIFLNKNAPEPRGAVVVHMLKIATPESNREYFFAMDGLDLQDLQDVITRAIKKEATLRNLVKQAGLTWIGR